MLADSSAALASDNGMWAIRRSSCLYSSSKLRPLALWLLISWMADSSTAQVFSDAVTTEAQSAPGSPTEASAQTCLSACNANVHAPLSLVFVCIALLPERRHMLTSIQGIDLQRMLEWLDLELREQGGVSLRPSGPQPTCISICHEAEDDELAL